MRRHLPRELALGWRCRTRICSSAPAGSSASATSCSGTSPTRELYFCDALWPDFDDAELERALRHFAGRQRRFGLTESQVARWLAGCRQRIATALLLAGGASSRCCSRCRRPRRSSCVAVAVLAGAWEWSAFRRRTCVTRPGSATWRRSASPACLPGSSPPTRRRLATFLLVTALWWLVAFCWVVFAPARGGAQGRGSGGFRWCWYRLAIGLSRLRWSSRMAGCCSFT